MPFLSMGDTVSLDNAVTNSKARPHLVKAYEGLESPGINGHMYQIERDYSCRAQSSPSPLESRSKGGQSR